MKVTKIIQKDNPNFKNIQVHLKEVNSSEEFKRKFRIKQMIKMGLKQNEKNVPIL